MQAVIDWLTARAGERSTAIGAIGIAVAIGIIAASYIVPPGYAEIAGMMRRIGEALLVPGAMLVIYREKRA